MTLPSRTGRESHDLDPAFLALAEGLGQGVLILDPLGSCVYANPAAAALFGLDLTSTPGSSWLSRLPPEEHALLRGRLSRSGVGLGSERFLLRHANAAGAVRATSCSLQPVGSSEAAVAHWLLTVDAAPELPATQAGQIDPHEQVHRLQGVLNSLFAFVGVMTPDGTLIEANRAPLEAAGLTSGEVLGKKFWDCPWWNYDEQVRSQLREACERASRGESPRYDVEVMMASGLMTIDFTIVPMFDSAGRLAYLIPSAVNVSERVRVEAALRLSEETARRQLAEIRATYDAAPIGLCVLDSELRWVRINARLAEMNGYPPEAHIGRTVSELLPDLGEDSIRVLQGVLTTGQPVLGVEIQGETPARPGVHRTWIEHFLPIRDEQGEVVGINVVCEEVTEKKRTEESLRSSLERTSLALSAGQMGTWEWDLATGRMTWSDELFQLMRLRPDQFTWTLESFIERVYPEDRTAFRRHVEAAIQSQGTNYEVQCRVVRGDGAVRWLAERGVIRRDAAGRALTIIGVSADQTDRIEAERALRQSEARLRRVIQASLIGVAVWDARGWIPEANHAFLRLLGYDSGILNSGLFSWDRLTPPEHFGILQQALQRVRSQGVCPPFESELRHRDGHKVPVLMSGVTFVEGRGETGLAFVVDLTERKQSEAALRESDHRKSEFLAVLSHELRNPLSAIRNALHLLDTSTAEADRAWSLSVIDRQSRHLNHLIDDLLDLNRVDRGKITLRRKPIGLNDLVANAIEAIRTSAERHRHTLRFRRAENTLEVEADSTRLEQILMNLLSNAVKYTPDGGFIVVECRAEEDWAVITVSDTGVGIAPQMLPRIFEMFAQVGRSLDRAQGGLGIGLSLARSLVELHGGRIEARSAGPGLGSEFEVRLPRYRRSEASDHPAESSSPAPPSRATPASHVRILLVDDNVDSALGLQRFLKRLGHEVRVAHQGSDALTAARAALPDLVLLDIGMPGMDGYEVARRLREEHRGKPLVIVALSGFGQDEDRHRSEKAGFQAHLVKPVDLDVLTNLISEFAPH
ncbi:MAG: PAS domain S-box protein [Isosphaeraceae bacterium]